MIHESHTHSAQALNTVTIDFPHTQTASATIRKTAITAAKIIGLLTAGAGISYLIAINRFKSDPCLKNSSFIINSPDESFWDGCCRPLFNLGKCLGEKISNFSHVLNQCPRSVESGFCLENAPFIINSPDESFWDGCCRPLLNLRRCLEEKIPNFSHVLNQCPRSSDCDP
ncbi:hypothetical protein RHABOEDO_001299 [Candidatus Rhabdochlamydia oedothoracis]|uniref:Uncharacterized protein n=1 Tax=Candidatus Rhabdochlamydia oedothoracis TaxID=2720720 RepID=A0ABX8V1J5_9BACT|nr:MULTISPECIES: hypothetical protein [Rhabdochlamydia]KAG6559800.1 hypothetical protein RHOW815_000199 [Candidatus Rhabdochlamydia sp. W815]QYF49041.1 hypothetical protein RHABOEDO_001299 [Candidatus Rhabdochlamydia oedothoracis]